MKRIKAYRMRHPFVDKIVLGGAAFILGDSSVVHAQTTIPAPAPIQTWPQVMIAICTFVGYFFWFVLTFASVMAIVAAFNYVTAQDDTEKTAKARRTLTYAAIGVAVALCALAFPMIVGSIIAPSSSLKISCAG